MSLERGLHHRVSSCVRVGACVACNNRATTRYRSFRSILFSLSLSRSPSFFVSLLARFPLAIPPSRLAQAEMSKRTNIGTVAFTVAPVLAASVVIPVRIRCQECNVLSCLTFLNSPYGRSQTDVTQNRWTIRCSPGSFEKDTFESKYGFYLLFLFLFSTKRCSQLFSPGLRVRAKNKLLIFHFHPVNDRFDGPPASLYVIENEVSLESL